MTLQALQARQQTQSFFVRPALDQKAFSGHVALNGDLSGIFRTRKAQFREQPIDLLLAVSPVVFGIHAEYRFVVLHHQVRLGSRYRLDGQLSLEALVEPHAWAAAQALAEGWMPASFIMMDVAVFSDGSARIIEFNSVHSSGIYHIRGEDFACLVEEAVRPRSIEASRPLSLTF
jgi:hypothetical protein